jgi:hypothetical protein
VTYPNLREQILAPDRSPIWWRGELGKRYQFLFGAAHDHYVQYVWDGVTQRFPTYAEQNSRLQLSKDRRIPLFQTEPIESQRARLRGWRSAHREAGLDTGVIAQSQPFWLPAVPKMRIVAGNSEVAMWTTLNPDGTLEFNRRDATSGGSNWNWDSAYPFKGEPTTIHRWWLIVYAPPSVIPNPPVVPQTAGLSAGSSLLVQQALDVFSLANGWRRQGSALWGWILSFDETLFDPLGGPGPGHPDGTWFRAYRDDGSFNRPTDARFYVQRACTPAP